jgi:hypothetical protein
MVPHQFNRIDGGSFCVLSRIACASFYKISKHLASGRVAYALLVVLPSESGDVYGVALPLSVCVVIVGSRSVCAVVPLPAHQILVLYG